MESLRGLLSSIEVINADLALHVVLQNIAEESARLIHAEPVGIGLLRAGQVVFQRVFRDGAWRDEPVELAVGEGLVGRVAAHGDAMVVNDPRHDLQERLPEGLGAAPHGFMVLPVVDRVDEEVGVLVVRRPQGRAPFGRRERQMLESLAHQAAVAIENGALYGELEEKLRNERQVTRMLTELSEMKSSFMVVTAHEMRTPLTILKGYHEVLRAGVLGALSREQEKSLEVCEKTTDRLIASFNDIVQMLEIDGGRLRIHARPVNVAGVLRELLGQMEPFVQQRGLEVALEGPESPALLALDPEKMHIALMNLVENAIKFTPDGGRIRLRVGEEDASVHIAVEDSGIGIEKEELERIFDKFYTSRDPLHHTSGTYQFRARGSGLGLSIAKGYVEAHGGRIWAESEGAGKGSAFHVVLPRA
jgi:signal transduction histidine kinase